MFQQVIKTLPKRYKGLPEVGNPMSPDMEKVKSMKPSEVLSVTTLEYELKPVFNEAGIKANFLNLTSLKNMQNSITDLGKKYGREKQAEAVVTKFDKKVADIQKQVEGKERTDSPYFTWSTWKLFSSDRTLLYWGFSKTTRW